MVPMVCFKSRKEVSLPQETLYVDVFGTAGEERAFLKGMGEDVIAGKPLPATKMGKAS